MESRAAILVKHSNDKKKTSAAIFVKYMNDLTSLIFVKHSNDKNLHTKVKKGLRVASHFLYLEPKWLRYSLKDRVAHPKRIREHFRRK